MDDAEETLDFTDRDLGALLINRGLVTPHQLFPVVKDYKSRKGTPQEKKFDDLLLEAGVIKDTGVLDNLRIQTRSYVRCSGCSKLFQIYYYNPSSVYTCKKCGAKLEQTSITEPTIMVGGPSALEKTTVATTGVTQATQATQGAFQTAATRGGARPEAKRTPPEVEAARTDPKKIFGKYVITKELGRGGTAVVYKAWDSMLCQYVALKIIKLHDPDESESSEPSNEIRDFQREARMSARLRHPNIIRIYELGSIDDKHYLAMELMEGPTFFELVHGARQRNTDTHFNTDPEKFLRVFRDVCRAVDYAHKLQPPVIHRDLKPQNVLMDTNHTPYVADFGLAKEVEMGHTVTVTGVVKGTPSYMAPEQAEGHSKDTDARTDVYSLGAILYEVLTGRPPFVGDNVRQVLNQIVTRIPDRPNEIIAKSLQENPNGPYRPKPVARELETICLKCLEKKKSDRYQSAKDLADDVDRFLQNLEIEAREPGVFRKAMRKMRAHPIISGTAAAIILAAAMASGAVALTKKEQKGSIGEIVKLAQDSLQARDWAALRSQVDNLKKLDPSNSNIEDFEAAIKEHEAGLERCRAEWDAGLKRLKNEPVKPVIDALRAVYGRAEEIQADLRQQLDRALLEVQTASINKARDLAGGGPNPGWLDDKVRQAARTERERVAHLAALTQDPDFPFAGDAALETWGRSLDRLLGYQGTWNLRVNVAPFAEVVLLREGKEVHREFTPLGLRELEVLPGYKVELRWPAGAAAQKKTTHELNGLKHGAVVVVSGDISKGEIQVR